MEITNSCLETIKCWPSRYTTHKDRNVSLRKKIAEYEVVGNLWINRDGISSLIFICNYRSKNVSIFNETLTVLGFQNY
jgi:hypothetical protein